MTSPAAVLDRVLNEVLTSSDKWCQGDVARDASGNHVPPDSMLAASYCMVGAIKKAAADEIAGVGRVCDYPLQYWTLVGDTCAAVQHVIGIQIPLWNDKSWVGFEDVRIALKQARENLT
jgi:hypothetical protein